MAIDTSIYARIQPPQIESPVNTLAQMMQLQGAQQANQLNALKMAEAQRGIERQNQLRALAGGFTQEMTPEQQVGALTRGGFFEEAKTLGESAAKIAKDRREAEKFQISNARDRLSMAGQLLGGVKDQASYDQARQTALASGFDANQIPEQYDPQWVEQARARALTSEQQLEQVWKQKGYDLDVEKFGETKRHQRAQEGLTARGQNMADARARDQAATAVTYQQDAEGNLVALPTKVQPGQVVRGTSVVAPGAGMKPLAGKAQTVTEGERKAATLLQRLRGSQQQLQTALSEQPSAAKPGVIAQAVRNAPVVGSEMVANTMTGQSRQRVEAAQLDMLDAALTLGTGAAYTKEQLQGYAKSYFPQIGDDAKTVADKKARLENVIKAAEIAAGRAAGESVVPTQSGAGNDPLGIRGGR